MTDFVDSVICESIEWRFIDGIESAAVEIKDDETDDESMVFWWVEFHFFELFYFFKFFSI
jgi:hypothetical protein